MIHAGSNRFVLRLSGYTPGWVLPGASVDLNFATNQYWSGSYQAATAFLSCTRAQTVTSYATDLSGNLIPFAANTLRITNQGLLVEQGSTNLMARSNNLAATWVVTTASASANLTDPSGVVNSGWTVTQTGANGTASRYQINTTVANDSATYVASAYVAKQTVGTVNGYPSLNMVLSGGTAVNAGIVIDVVNGAVQSNGGAGYVSSTISSAGNWWRVSVTFANNSSGNTVLSYNFYPAWNAAYSATFSTIQNGANGFSFGQIEAASFATSYIPTTTVAVARNADNISLTGVASSTLAAAQGSVIAWSTLGQAARAGTLLDSNGNIMLGETAANKLTTAITAGLTTGNTATWTGLVGSGLSWNAAGRTLILNNGTAATDSQATTPATTFHIGSTSGSSAFSDSYIRRLAEWNIAISAAALGPNTVAQ